MAANDTAPQGDAGAVLLSKGQHLALVVRYDGTDYHGFQTQANDRTIQGDLEAALQRVLGTGRIVGGSRTDAGVHAQGQVVVWDGNVPMPLGRIAWVVNQRLASAIRVMAVWLVPAEWDPRREAMAKQYSYRLWIGKDPPPLLYYRFAAVHDQPLSWGRLQSAARLFVGTHDFGAFRTAGSSAKTSVRTILASHWGVEDRGNIWRYQVVGTGFLYRMVRHMVAGMLNAAEPGQSIEPIRQSLENPNVKMTPLAAAHGLTLDWIQFRQGKEQDKCFGKWC